MKSMPVAPRSEQCVARLIDANLDRAREGLRVVEDWCRFGLDRADLVQPLKDWRQQLGQRQRCMQQMQQVQAAALHYCPLQKQTCI